MKPLAVLFLLSLSLSGYTQTQTPKKEFAIVLSQDKIEISASESKEIEIKILRSKAYLKSSAVMGLSSSLPSGIEVTFSPEKGNFDVTKVIIKSSNAVPGQYSLIVNATLNGRTKGSIIKLNVSDKVIASDGKQ
jgi:hypothetical protein